MEALAALSLAGNVVQSVEFGTRIVSRSIQISKSANGSLKETADCQAVTRHLTQLSAKLKRSAEQEGDQTLIALCQSCGDLAKEFLSALEKVTVNDPVTNWKSIRKALRSVWSKEKLYEIEGRLSRDREQVTVHLVHDLRTKYDLLTVSQSRAFGRLEASSQALVTKLIDQQVI